MSLSLMSILLVLIKLLFFVNISESACNLVDANGGNRDRRTTKTELKIVEYNVEWLFSDGCVAWDSFEQSVGGLWDMSYEEAELTVADLHSHLEVSADNGHQKLTGKFVVSAERTANGGGKTTQASDSYTHIDAVLDAVQNDDEELIIVFDNGIRMIFDGTHKNGNSNIRTFRANYQAGTKKIKYKTGPLPATYKAAAKKHLENIAARLDEINADIFVLEEVCDCPTLEATLAEMNTHKADYRAYMLDTQPNHMKVGVLSKLDPTLKGGMVAREAKLELIPHIPRGMQLSFAPPNWGKTIHLMGTHLTAGTDACSARSTQAGHLKTEWQKHDSGNYIILTGDFNSYNTHSCTSTDDTTYNKDLQAVLGDYRGDTTKFRYWLARPTNAQITLAKNVAASDRISSTADTGDKGTNNSPNGGHIMRIIRKKNDDANVVKSSLKYTDLNPIFGGIQNNDKWVKVFFDNNNKYHITYTLGDANGLTPQQLKTDYGAGILKYRTSGQWFQLTLANRNSHCEITADTNPSTGMVGKYLTKVDSSYAADVPITDFASAETALKAIETDGSANSMTLTWNKYTPDHYQVITTGGNELRDSALTKGPAVAKDRFTNDVYTMNRGGHGFIRCERESVYDYFFVSDKILNNALGAASFSFLHKKEAQLGKYSDHDPIQLKLTIPGNTLWPNAKLIDYGNNLDDGYKYLSKSKQHSLKHNYKESRLFMHNADYLQQNNISSSYYMNTVIVIISFIFICIIFGGICVVGFGIFFAYFIKNAKVQQEINESYQNYV